MTIQVILSLTLAFQTVAGNLNSINMHSKIKRAANIWQKPVLTYTINVFGIGGFVKFGGFDQNRKKDERGRGRFRTNLAIRVSSFVHRLQSDV